MVLTVILRDPTLDTTPVRGVTANHNPLQPITQKSSNPIQQFTSDTVTLQLMYIIASGEEQNQKLFYNPNK